MTETIHPALFQFDGEIMVPLNLGLAKRQYEVNEVYRLAPHEERSAKSHGHYFACIAESHRNLPEHLAERFPTPEHLRKWALIKAGYRDERSIVCASKAEALRVSAFIRPLDDFSVVRVSEAVVIVYTAKSQSVKAQGKAKFQQSKQAVLDIVSGMIDVPVETLRQNAGMAA